VHLKPLQSKGLTLKKKINLIALKFDLNVLINAGSQFVEKSVKFDKKKTIRVPPVGLELRPPDR
jgi:hypothetical protein